MSAVKNPQEKKRLVYERDHFVVGKYDKAFRRQWPLKKRKASRSFRRAADRLVRRAQFDHEFDCDTSQIKIRPLYKWGQERLQERLGRKRSRRHSGFGRKKSK